MGGYLTEGTTGFTSVGLQNLKEFIGIFKADPTMIVTLHETPASQAVRRESSRSKQKIRKSAAMPIPLI